MRSKPAYIYPLHHTFADVKAGAFGSFRPVDVGQGAETKAVSARRIHVSVDGHVVEAGRDFEDLAHLLIQLEIRDGTPILGAFRVAARVRHRSLKLHISLIRASRGPLELRRGGDINDNKGKVVTRDKSYMALTN